MIPAVTLRLRLLSTVWLICPSFPRRIEFVLDIRVFYAVSPSSRSSTLTCVHHDVFYFSLHSSHLHRNCICSVPEGRLASNFRAYHQTFPPSSRRFQHVGLIQILHFLKYQLIFALEQASFSMDPAVLMDQSTILLTVFFRSALSYHQID